MVEATGAEKQIDGEEKDGSSDSEGPPRDEKGQVTTISNIFSH